jgi:hypothetical protein
MPSSSASKSETSLSSENGFLRYAVVHCRNAVGGVQDRFSGGLCIARFFTVGARFGLILGMGCLAFMARQAGAAEPEANAREIRGATDLARSFTRLAVGGRT